MTKTTCEVKQNQRGSAYKAMTTTPQFTCADVITRRTILSVLAGIGLSLPEFAVAKPWRRLRQGDGFPELQAAIFRAAQSGSLAAVQRLSPDARNLSVLSDTGETLLQRALYIESAKGLITLLKAGANPSQIGQLETTIVHQAAQMADPRWLKILLQNGADPNVRDGLTQATPIVIAMRAERVEQFHLLLAGGTDVQQIDSLGNTLLHVAGQINEPWRALDLLRAGTDPTVRNAQRQTFQRYLFMTKESLLNEHTRQGRQAVRLWLQSHGIEIESS
jgi:uncharacterized protein